MPHIGSRLNNLFDVYRHLQVMMGILIIAVAASLCTGVRAADPTQTSASNSSVSRSGKSSSATSRSARTC